MWFHYLLVESRYVQVMCAVLVLYVYIFFFLLSTPLTHLSFVQYKRMILLIILRNQFIDREIIFLLSHIEGESSWSVVHGTKRLGSTWKIQVPRIDHQHSIYSKNWVGACFLFVILLVHKIRHLLPIKTSGPNAVFLVIRKHLRRGSVNLDEPADCRVESGVISGESSQGSEGARQKGEVPTSSYLIRKICAELCVTYWMIRFICG